MKWLDEIRQRNEYIRANYTRSTQAALPAFMKLREATDNAARACEGLQDALKKAKGGDAD